MTVSTAEHCTYIAAACSSYRHNLQGLRAGLFLHVLRRGPVELVLHPALQRVRRLQADAVVHQVHRGNLRHLYLNSICRGCLAGRT